MLDYGCLAFGSGKHFRKANLFQVSSVAFHQTPDHAHLLGPGEGPLALRCMKLGVRQWVRLRSRTGGLRRSVMLRSRTGGLTQSVR